MEVDERASEYASMHILNRDVGRFIQTDDPPRLFSGSSLILTVVTYKLSLHHLKPSIQLLLKHPLLPNLSDSLGMKLTTMRECFHVLGRFPDTKSDLLKEWPLPNANRKNTPIFFHDGATDARYMLLKIV